MRGGPRRDLWAGPCLLCLHSAWDLRSSSSHASAPSDPAGWRGSASRVVGGNGRGIRRCLARGRRGVARSRTGRGRRRGVAVGAERVAFHGLLSATGWNLRDCPFRPRSSGLRGALPRYGAPRAYWPRAARLRRYFRRSRVAGTFHRRRQCGIHRRELGVGCGSTTGSRGRASHAGTRQWGCQELVRGRPAAR